MKFLYNLVEKEQRKVFVDEQDLYYVSSEKYESNEFKKNYDRFISEKKDQSFVLKIKKRFNSIQASSFSSKPGLFSKFLSFISTPVPKNFKIGKFLDIGCSTGIFLENLPPDWDKYGIEITQEACDIAKRKNLKVENTIIENCQLNVQFDMLRASHVIEHITDYDAFFSKCSQLLYSGGKMILYTPNSLSISRMLFGKYWAGFYEKTHFIIFNLKNLSKIAEKYDFIVVSQKTYEMGMLGGCLVSFLRLNETKLEKPLYWFFLLIFYPVGLIFAKMNLGDALYLELEKK